MEQDAKSNPNQLMMLDRIDMHLQEIFIKVTSDNFKVILPHVAALTKWKYTHLKPIGWHGYFVQNNNYKL